MKALIVQGGWAGHEPGPVSQLLQEVLTAEGLKVEVSDTLDRFKDGENLLGHDVIIPLWTMGKIAGDQLKPLMSAIKAGVGLAGCHGGMGDAFRESTDYQFMVGGQWVAHPGGIIKYRVHVVDHADEVTAGIEHFDMESEQYYMHVDPSNHVLATTTFECNGCTMPVMWKRLWGRGRVFYTSLGHVAKDFQVGEALETFKRGILWAARGRAASR